MVKSQNSIGSPISRLKGIAFFDKSAKIIEENACIFGKM